MKLLDGKLYDPSTAVNKVTTAALAMTALDTTNLRLTVTVPKSGKILWKVKGTVHGATTLPQIMLGVLDGSTVRGRKAAMYGGGNVAATSIVAAWAEGIITGLTPGASITLDAAYGVETVVASTGFKYGGPNNTTANDAWGGCAFELWDPDPYNVDAAGNVQADVREVNGTAQTAGDIIARLPAALVGGRMDASVGAMAADVLTAAATAADFGTEIGAAVWASATRRLSDGTNIVLAKGTGVTGFNDLDAAGVRAAVGLAAANLDTQLDAMPTAAEIRVEMDANSVDLNTLVIASAHLDADVSSRLATSGYTAPDNASVAAIKLQTDKLVFTAPGFLDVNVLVVNGVTVGGDGTAGNPWGPA